MVGRAAAAALAATVLTGAVASCGEGAGAAEESSSDESVGVGRVVAGSVAPLAQCSDWNAGTVEARFATIAEIHGRLNEAGADGPTPDLPEQEAYELLDRACQHEAAAGVRLYKLYARGAAFARFLPEDDEP